MVKSVKETKSGMFINNSKHILVEKYSHIVFLSPVIGKRQI